MIDRKTRKLAMTASALAAVCVVTAACTGGGDDDDDSFTPELVLKDDNSPANFACNGSFADPVSTGTNVTMSFLAVEQTTTGTPPSANTRIVVYDPLTGNTDGSLSATTNSSGMASISGLEDSTRYAFKLSRPAGSSTYIDTYTFSVLSPAVGDTSGSTTLRIITQTVYSVFIGLLSATPEQVAGTTQVAGSIEDCDGDAIQNAYIEAPGPGGTGVAKRCGEADHGFPCVAYFAGGTPSKNALDTDASGQFVILGVPPNVDYVVKVMGVTTANAAPVQIGQATIRGKADTISLTSTHPLPE